MTHVWPLPCRPGCELARSTARASNYARPSPVLLVSGPAGITYGAGTSSVRVAKSTRSSPPDPWPCSIRAAHSPLPRSATWSPHGPLPTRSHIPFQINDSERPRTSSGAPSAPVAAEARRGARRSAMKKENAARASRPTRRSIYGLVRVRLAAPSDLTLAAGTPALMGKSRTVFAHASENSRSWLSLRPRRFTCRQVRRWP